MTTCQSLVPVRPAVPAPEPTPPAEVTQEFEAWGRFLLGDDGRPAQGIESLDRWLDLNA
jgi:hypothetical protein